MRIIEFLSQFLFFDIPLLKRFLNIKTYTAHLTIIIIITFLDSSFFTINDKIDIAIKDMLKDPIFVDNIIKENDK